MTVCSVHQRARYSTWKVATRRAARSNFFRTFFVLFLCSLISRNPAIHLLHYNHCRVAECRVSINAPLQCNCYAVKSSEIFNCIFSRKERVVSITFKRISKSSNIAATIATAKRLFVASEPTTPCNSFLEFK